MFVPDVGFTSEWRHQCITKLVPVSQRRSVRCYVTECESLHNIKYTWTKRVCINDKAVWYFDCTPFSMLNTAISNSYSHFLESSVKLFLSAPELGPSWIRRGSRMAVYITSWLTRKLHDRQRIELTSALFADRCQLAFLLKILLIQIEIYIRSI